MFTLVRADVTLKTMKFAKGMAKITSGNDDFERETGIWLFTQSKTGKLASETRKRMAEYFGISVQVWPSEVLGVTVSSSRRQVCRRSMNSREMPK